MKLRLFHGTQFGDLHTGLLLPALKRCPGVVVKPIGDSDRNLFCSWNRVGSQSLLEEGGGGRGRGEGRGGGRGEGRGGGGKGEEGEGREKGEREGKRRRG